MPLQLSCRARWCLAWPGESTVVRDRLELDPDLLAVLEDVDALGGRGIEATVERVEERPVDPGGRVDQPGRVGQVAGALRVDVDGGLREGPGHVAHAAGVVEVDVGDHHAGQVVGTEAEAVEVGEQGRHRALTARLDQHRRVALDEVPGGDPSPIRRAGCRARARPRRCGCRTAVASDRRRGRRDATGVPPAAGPWWWFAAHPVLTGPSAWPSSAPSSWPGSSWPLSSWPGSSWRPSSWPEPSWPEPSWPEPSWPEPSWPEPSWPEPSWPGPSWPETSSQPPSWPETSVAPTFIGRRFLASDFRARDRSVRYCRPTAWRDRRWSVGGHSPSGPARAEAFPAGVVPTTARGWSRATGPVGTMPGSPWTGPTPRSCVDPPRRSLPSGSTPGGPGPGITWSALACRDPYLGRRVDQGHVGERLGEVADQPPATGSYSSDSRPRSLRSASSRSNSWRASCVPAEQGQAVGQPERAGQEGALAARRARRRPRSPPCGTGGRSPPSIRSRSIASMVPATRRIGGREEAHERDHQQAGVELVGAVVLGEGALRRVEALSQTWSWISWRMLRQLLDRALECRTPRPS